MKVALIIYGSIKTLTGGYIYDRILCEYLEARGVTVKIISQPYKRFWGLLRNNFSRKTYQSIIDFEPDIILQDCMNFVSLFLLNKKLRRKTKVPLFTIVHLLQSNLDNSFLMSIIIKKMERKYLESVDGFIFNSHSTKRAVLLVIGSTLKALVAHPGKDRLNVKLDQDITIKSNQKKIMIIFIGNLVHNKGLHLLLKALSQIDTNLWELSVVGDVKINLKYSKSIFKMLTRLNLEDNVKVLGPLTLDNLKKEMITHHILAVPSYYESYGIVYAEAMGAGLPIVASRNGGAQEIVSDTINGFLVTPGDINMIRDSILKLITHRELLAKMSIAALVAYKNMATWNESMEKIHLFLKNQTNLT